MRMSACTQQRLGSNGDLGATLTDWAHQAREWARHVSAQSISIRSQAGETLLDLPLVLGVIASVVKPHLALLAAIVMLATHTSIVIETARA